MACHTPPLKRAEKQLEMACQAPSQSFLKRGCKIKRRKFLLILFIMRGVVNNYVIT